MEKTMTEFKQYLQDIAKDEKFTIEKHGYVKLCDNYHASYVDCKYDAAKYVTILALWKDNTVLCTNVINTADVKSDNFIYILAKMFTTAKIQLTHNV